MSAALLLSVLIASLLGSAHCAAMCGPIVAFCGGGSAGDGKRHWGALAAYSLGRLVTYVLLGAAAGGLGAAVDLAGTSSGIGRVAAALAGLVMALWGAALLFDALGHPLIALRVPAALQAASAWILRRAMARSPLARSAAVGLASSFLPCGWLYAFALTAAGTGRVVGGALVMAAFWVGTVPLLFGLGLGVQALAGPLRRHAPVIAALALIAIGLHGVFGRVNIPAFAGRITAQGLGGGSPVEPPACECHRP